MPSTKTLTRDEMIQNQALDEEVYKAEAMLKAAREFRQKHKVKGENQLCPVSYTHLPLPPTPYV